MSAPPRGAAVAAALVALGLASCAQLDPYPVDTCGNAVVENDGVSTFEQCDSHVAADAMCGAPGTPGACRYLCALRDEGDPASAALCPVGTACGLDGVCRRATGTFALGSVEANFALGSRLGDFDGSGTADVLTAGLSRIDISYLDGSGAVTSRQAFGSGLLLLPDVGYLDAPSSTGADFSDAVFTTDGDVVVALGSEGGLTPTSYAGIRLDIAPPVVFFSVPGAAARGYDLSAAMAVAGGDPVQIAELDGERVTTVDPDWPVPDLPYHVLTANLDPSSPRCHEVVFSYGLFLVQWRPCRAGDLRTEEEPRAIAFEGGESGGLAQAGAPAAVDLDADGALDLVVEINACWGDDPGACAPDVLAPADDREGCCVLYVGWGEKDAGGEPTGRVRSSRDEDGVLDVMGPWQPVALPTVDGPVFLHPLAWGNFDGDPWPDFVSAVGLFRGAPPDAWQRDVAAVNPGFLWSDAEVGDVDRDGLDDVVASSPVSPAIDYYRGDPSGTMGRTGVQVPRPFFELLLGDFDGDARLDVVGRTITAEVDAEELAVLFFDDGTLSAPQTIGRFPARENDPGTSDDDTSSILQIAAAPLVTNGDPLHDLAAITTYDDDGVEKVAIALYEGRTNRQLVAPIVITHDGETQDVGVAALGHFAEGGPSIVADRFALHLDPVTLELLGGAREIGALGPAGLASSFGGLSPLPELMIVAAGDLDGDAFDELVAAVPGCATRPECPAGGTCCERGTETTRLFLLERVGDGFAPLPAAPAPIPMPSVVARGFLEEDLARVGRLEVLDVNDDGIGEILAIGGMRTESELFTRGSVIALVDGAFREIPLPSSVTLEDATLEVNVHGFARLTTPEGEPLLALATSAGLFSIAVDRETFAWGAPELVLDDAGEPLALGEVSNVEAGDVTGDGLVDLVLTRPFATEVHVGLESLGLPGDAP